MGAKKHGSDAFGHWDRDENSLPRYDLVPSRLPLGCAPLRHVLGTGHVYMLADHRGVMQLAAAHGHAPVCVNATAPHVASALYAQVDIDGQDRSLFVGTLPQECNPLMRCGVGYVQYEGELTFRQDRKARVTLAVFAPPSQTFFVVQLAIQNTGADEIKGRVALVSDVCVVPPAQQDTAPGVFVRQAIAMLTDLHPELGDLFLAGSEPWQARADSDHLRVEADVRIAAGATFDSRLLFGFGRDCSLDWLQKQLQTSVPGDIGEQWSERLSAMKIRCPELWMQEECLWDTGRLLAFVNENFARGNAVILPGGESLFGPCLYPERDPVGVPLRDVLALAVSVSDWVPALALSSLQAAVASQARSGRMAETFGRIPGAEIDASVDRSDLEILLLLAWCEYVESQSDRDCLETVCPFCDGGEATVWDHLCRAYSWIRDELRQGPRGLIRILAGDWSGYLNRVGVEGKGESVLNTAMAAFALHRFAELARRRDETRLADQVDEWNQQLRMAVADAFDGRFFRRAYTDAGRPVGSQAEQRVFTDVQAWAVLARCGTVQQRAHALESVIEGSSGGSRPVPVVSRPYPVSAPQDISTASCLPGEGENGGVSMAVAGWFIWALALEGNIETAFREWERTTIRRRSAESEELAAPLLSNLASLASAEAGRLAGTGGSRDLIQSGPLPNAHAVAWQSFALRRILS